MKREIYRQGDVLLVSAEELPDGSEEMPVDDRIVLAYGEVTGHAHAIAALQARVYTAGGTRYLKVGDAGADLRHEEHRVIHLQPGLYRIVHQREYAPERSRPVID